MSDVYTQESIDKWFEFKAKLAKKPIKINQISVDRDVKSLLTINSRKNAQNKWITFNEVLKKQHL